ncbi:MAG: RsmB/NOP family class I SAM-dependent RNA methyltransferase [Beijerinckiaceae bacterium]|nr:RsmB/NOP family class I SAM-dependent RNA methyltransferase [Beijerinckiaceae bacterium]
MTPAARISSAIEILADLDQRKRPASEALRDWGLSHRFAGSGDRAALASLVYDAMRKRASSAWIMGGDTPRAVMLCALRDVRGMDVEAIGALCTGERFDPVPLSEDEHERLANGALDGAPAHIVANYPEWLEPALEHAFGEGRVAELEAMCRRAPVDLRVNTLKAIRPAALAALSHFNPEPTPHSPIGLRVPARADGRAPSLQAEPAFIKGLVEVQDEGSQLVSLLSGVKAGDQVLDLCAGGGGKSLALAAIMNNRGQIFAADNDARRLAPIHDRVTRAGVRNVQVRTPRGKAMAIDDLKDKMDVVLVDAPCTGTGTWRRNPDAKWRIRPGSLDARLKDQREVLELAAASVRVGGRLVYITCSLLPEENGDQVKAFLNGEHDFEILEPAVMADEAGLRQLGSYLDPSGLGLLLTPHRTGTDGFFISVMTRVS